MGILLGFAGMSSLKLISATDALYSGSLLKSIDEQRNVGLFCDVTIIINDRKFRAHRNILSGSSTYFHQLFSAAGQVIELDFVRAEIFDVILNYIYSSKIIRIPSDLLEELITAGQALGVKFIANLHVPLSQVKGLPGLSKEPGEESVKCEDAQQKNDLIRQVAGSGCTSIVTEAFSLYAEEFDQANDLDKGDVLFISKQASKNKGNPSSTSHCSRSSVVIDVDGSSVREVAPNNDKKIASSEPSKVIRKAEDGDNNASSSKKLEADDLSLHSSSSEAQPDSSSLSVPAESPIANTNMRQSPASSSLSNTPATPAQINCSPTKSPPNTVPKEDQQILGVQKKELAVLEKATTQSVDFKSKLSDVGSLGTTKNGARLNSPQSATGIKKTITLDKASEIDSLSTGCKVYANIGENTYDIVPVKEDPGEGDSKASRARKSQVPPSFSPDSSPNSPRGASSKKKAKVEQDDHYELIMDGKTFYVCIICKRPYVCLTSLRRHFNTHSWEKKYPCHYCDKVFALAEYRTKHEVYHTGERRYQCLLCNEFFINYQLLSSHCKQVHNQDPSGRKEKDDTNNNLYRLLPCKTLQFKPYSYVTDGSGGIPIINEDGIVYHVDPSKGPMAGQGPHPSSQGKPVNWDDIFVEPGEHVPSLLDIASQFHMVHREHVPNRLHRARLSCMAHQERMALPLHTAHLELMDHMAHQQHLARLLHMVQQDHTVHQEHMARPFHTVHQEHMARRLVQDGFLYLTSKDMQVIGSVGRQAGGAVVVVVGGGRNRGLRRNGDRQRVWVTAVRGRAAQHCSSDDAQKEGHDVKDGGRPQQVVEVHHVLATSHLCVLVVTAYQLHTAVKHTIHNGTAKRCHHPEADEHDGGHQLSEEQETEKKRFQISETAHPISLLSIKADDETELKQEVTQEEEEVDEGMERQPLETEDLNFEKWKPKPKPKRTCRQMMADVKKFLWNPESREFMGRSGRSWSLILLFYGSLYVFLAAMFVGCMWALMWSISPYAPTYNDRVVPPGMTMSPHGDGFHITFNASKRSSWENYVQALENYLEPYDDSTQELRNMACTQDAYFQQDDSEEGAERKACQFKRSWLGECSGLQDPDFGYSQGKPCFILQMNRVNYTSPLVAVRFSGVQLATQLRVQCQLNVDQCRHYIHSLTTTSHAVHKSTYCLLRHGIPLFLKGGPQVIEVLGYRVTSLYTVSQLIP
ncbi:hypothetical protein SKAU_G00226870 [Synaphobranchus kaupii]|uniref:Protein ATP1B4 n=1 Tax=Synaphobranchus kaupii TaxID=118154 RepID=A0A9Q1F4U2_SYNKA|nr:hypothetical protein SKAU_G00226870 [Synaphobranchus kaupii]